VFLIDLYATKKSDVPQPHSATPHHSPRNYDEKNAERKRSAAAAKPHKKAADVTTTVAVAIVMSEGWRQEEGAPRSQKHNRPLSPLVGGGRVRGGRRPAHPHRRRHAQRCVRH